MKYHSIADDVKLGKDVKLANFINLYGCSDWGQHKDRYLR